MNNLDKNCCFTGPRPQNLPWQDENGQDTKQLTACLETQIRQAVDNGYRHFISGMAIGVDLYAAQIVLNVKKEQPSLGITLEAAISFPSQPSKWTKTQQTEYASILSQADKRTVIGQEPSTKNFNKRNNYMVDNVSLLIAVKPDRYGGTQRTIDYAKSKKRKIVVIDPKNLSVTTS